MGNLKFDFNGKKKASKNLKRGLTLGALAGTAIGAAAGMLFAPKSGKETREDVKEVVSTTAVKVADGVKETVTTVNKKVSETAKNIAKLRKSAETEGIVEDSAVEESKEELA